MRTARHALTLLLGAASFAPAATALPASTQASAPAALPAAAAALTTRIADVTVYGSGARVVRRGEITGSGQYVVAGLPAGLDGDSVRVRTAAGHVVSVELADRVQAVVPDARLQELRTKVTALLAEQRALEDQRSVLQLSKEHLIRLLGQEEHGHADDVATARPSADTWRASLQFVTSEMTRALEALRETDVALSQLATRLSDARAALGTAESGQSVKLVDVLIDAVADAPTTLDVEYIIGNAGWEPLYDLRTSGDGTHVDLAYRAKVWQQTGEDWNESAIALSTAQPQRGAQGPEPQPIKLSVARPRPDASYARESLSKDEESQLQGLGYLGAAAAGAGAAAASPFAQVVAQGLSVQFRLPRAETILSRDKPTTVLVGEQSVDVTTEHYVTPALDTTVWLRGRAQNTTPWTLLPGVAAVHFGNDFIGNSFIDKPILPEQELLLHLGADPGLLVTREQTLEQHEEPGFLGRRQNDIDGWRIRIENVGAHAAAADGSVSVIVREAMPVSTDERIEVEVLEESLAPSRDERWKKELEEQGLHTWIVSVPKAGKLDIAWKLRITWPEDVSVWQSRGER